MIAQFEKGSYRWSTLAVVLLTVLGGVVLTNAEEAKELFDINATVAQLDIDNATLDDVIYIFGEPLKYVWDRETIPRDEIPTDLYCMVYPDFSIQMGQNSIGELRFESAEAGYVFGDAIRIGSSLDEVLAFLGEPMETVVGEPVRWINDVLYMDIDGEEGRCYYQRADWNVRMFFADYEVIALYVTSSSSGDNKEMLREEDLPSTSFINEEGHIVDKVDYPFVNDPEVIGSWESVDYVSDIEDFDPNRRSHRGDLFFKELFVFENGKTHLGITWTKGLFLDVEGKEASEYVIEEIDGTTYMFFEWKGGNYRIYHIKPGFYVLKKVPGKVYVESRTYDKVDYPFVDDPEAIGTWEAIDFVETPEEFDPGQRRWIDGEMFLAQLVIDPNGQMSQILGTQVTEARRAESKRVRESFLEEVSDPNAKISEIVNKQLLGPRQVWTKGLIIEPAAKKASRYQIKEIQGATYMFYEWKSGDYVLRQMKPSYYVLRKK